MEWEMSICCIETLYNCSIEIIVVELSVVILFLTLRFCRDDKRKGEKQEKGRKRKGIMENK